MNYKRRCKEKITALRMMLRCANPFLLVPLALCGPLILFISTILCIVNGYGYYIARPGYMLPWPFLLLISAALSLLLGALIGAQRAYGNAARRACLCRAYLLCLLKMLFMLCAAPMLLCCYLPFFSLLSVGMIALLQALLFFELRDGFVFPVWCITLLFAWMAYLFFCVLGVWVLN